MPPVPTRAVIHRQVSEVAADHGWTAPSYRTVCDIVAALDLALVCFGTEGVKRYGEVFELVHCREADAGDALQGLAQVPNGVAAPACRQRRDG